MGHGSFMIYGKKNFVTPIRMEMGFGMMWKVGSDTYQNHDNERLVRTMQADDDETNDKDEETMQMEKEPKIDSQIVPEMKEEDGMVVNTFVPKAKTVQRTKGNKKGDKKAPNKQQQEKIDAELKRQEIEDEKKREMAAQGKISKHAKRAKKQTDKAKKLMDKFGDSDDEENQERMAMIGSKAINKTKLQQLDNQFNPESKKKE